MMIKGIRQSNNYESGIFFECFCLVKAQKKRPEIEPPTHHRPR